MDNDSSVENVNLSSSASHHRTQKSTTLNRKYVKRPDATTSESTAIDSIAKRRAEDLKRRQAIADKINRERLSALKSGKSLQPSTNAQDQSSNIHVNLSSQIPQPVSPDPKPLSTTIERNLVASPSTSMKSSGSNSSTRLKDSALQNALKAAKSVDKEELSGAVTSSISTRGSFGAKKVLLALGCAVLAVGAIGYFVSLNTPDLSVRVAAVQSGIEAAYPSYVPRGYTLSDITSKEGELEMIFTSSDGTNFVLTEEKSSWDNDALETNYVKKTWGSNYTSIREQGITIFISGSDAAWTNGGLVYKINSSSNNLTKKQIKSIVVSL